MKITCKVPKAGSGYCRSVKNNGCPGGKFHTGFCPGSSDIKCCVKTPAPKSKPKPKPKPDPCSSAVLERLVFQDSISTFLAARGARRPGCFDWNSDGCSWAPDGFGAFNFKPACYRHDFGYRNTKVKRTFNPAMKDRIDRKFKSDMDEICSKERNFLVRKACQFAAGRYYNAVKEFGKRDDTNEILEDEIFI